MPAEWERHQATWLSWPHNIETWPGKLDLAQLAFARIVRTLAEHETVHINVNGLEMERQASRILGSGVTASGQVVFHQFPTDDAWCRDYGACLVRRSATCDASSGDMPAALAAIDWKFNCWGDKYPAYEFDNQIAGRMAAELGVPRFTSGYVLEGGAIDVNGVGSLLTTESCLLNPNRNPTHSRAGTEQLLADYLGVDQVLWLAGGISGDDTDGHVDGVARFVAPQLIVAVVENDPIAANHAILQENLRRLKTLRGPDGKHFEIRTLPPAPTCLAAGRVLPASYANFYMANELILVPIFGHTHDERACAVLRELLPSREVIPIDCSDIVVGLGAIHCLTQQVPAV